jgi:hypothetical protein
MGMNPSVSARIVVKAMSVIGLSASAASPRAVRTNGKLVLMLSRRVNGNIWETMAVVTCPETTGTASPASSRAARVRGPAMPSASRPALL